MKPGGIQTFLIADIRGYTRFTQAEGDEAAGRLAAKFASLTRENVEAHGGRLLELRGDEALVIFDSPRLALRAAVDLQARFLSATEAEPELPLGVGIGIDAGEAVAVEEGYRGGALNLAARLCSLAGPGEILTSAEVTHLAQRIPGISYQSKGKQQLKGLASGTEAVKVFSEDGDPALRFAALRSQAVEQGRRRRRLVGSVAGAAVVVVALALFFMSMRAPVQGRGLEADSVGLIDLDTGEVLARVKVGDRPGGVAVGADSVWVANSGDGTVSRIDPSSKVRIDTIQVGAEPSGIAFGYGQLWVANGPDATVSRVDPETSTEVQKIDVDSGPTGMAAGLGSVWVTNKLDDTVSKIDPGTGKIEKTIDVGDGPSEIALGFGAVWVSNQFAGTVSKIDPDTNSVTDSVNVGNGPLGITSGSGAVWVANSLDDTVSQIDPQTQSEADKVPVGSGPSDVTAGEGSLWVTNETEGTLSRIDANSSEVVDTIDVGASPAMTAVTREGLWVAVKDDGASHRGGTLTIVGYEPDSIDPGVAYEPTSWELLSVTNDGLVGFKRTGGVEGATLVPNLATDLPTPTDGGRTYTFQLRPDIRYSTGKRVAASDVRRSLERTLQLRVGAPFYEAIRGASACTPRRCDLSEGIIADDVVGTVTFHLQSPDPDFLHKLTLPFAWVLPANTPQSEQDGGVPATGPYMIANYEPGRQLELVRNPHFREWSRAAQPQGYADEIVYRFDVKPREHVSQVISGRADVTYKNIAPRDVEEITIRYPERTVVTVGANTYFMALNTRVPPFDDQRVRRAVNYAVDRERIVDLNGGPNRAGLTCQVLPPNFPSYEPYCPYTSDPAADGKWRGPDLEQARRLIAASGTKGMKITVWLPGFLPRQLGEYFVSLLTDLGYVANLKYLDDYERYFTTVADSRTRAQIAFNGWFADYPAPSTFFESLLTCDGYIPRGAGNGNIGGFCDPRIDSLIARALELQVSDPVAASGLWTRIDAMIVDRAPWVPLFNPRHLLFLSERAGNFQYQQAGVLLEQVWVR
ncbi:MAG TPA: ABC transporter substrate-binding protein [Actinomycetota bacterium]|nr:ABC transporter substrate-binding protein [Actinomycetota bacterium]